MLEVPDNASSSISGLVVEYIVAIDVTRVRFPADAFIAARRVLGILPRARALRLSNMIALFAKAQQHQWSSGRIHRCHRCDPGSIPG